MIAKVFHHIWLGDDELPATVVRMRETWARYHPDWEMRLWRETDLGWLRNYVLFERAPSYAQKADIASYEVVQRYGGVHLDTGIECLKPIDGLVEGLDFFAGREAEGMICPFIFGASPGHRLLREVIASLPVSCRMHRSIDLQTGSGMLTRVVHRGRWEGRPGVRIFPASFFYPYARSEPWRRSGPFPTAFAVHHWDRSPNGKEGVKVALPDLRPTGPLEARMRLSALTSIGRSHLRHWTRDRTIPSVKRLAQRYLNKAAAQMPQAVSVGNGTILVRGPLNTRLLCMGEDLSLTPDLVLDGTYEPDFIDFLRRHLRSGMTVVDIGANLGLHTIVAARLGARVIAYECNPEMADLLERNVAMNWFEDRIVIVRKAAGRVTGSLPFFAPLEMKGLGSLVLPPAQRTARADSALITVPCERLDVGLADLEFIDLLKIDVEGAEADVLAGADGLLEKRRIGMLAMEYRLDVIDEPHRRELEDRLRHLATHQHVTFHVPSGRHAVPLDEVLTTAHYPNLLIRFPWSSLDLG